ncbi:ATP-dependent Clp protease ATP-binding subunit ClpX [Bienertia sinuspersici]
MTKYCGYDYHHNVNVLAMLLASLMFASMIINSQCSIEVGEDINLDMKWVFQMSNRDEIVQMAGYGEEKLSTVLITGTVVCNEACLPSKHNNHHHLPLRPHPISGALVGAACRTNKKDKSPSWAKGVTDKFGDFVIDLPSHLHAITNLDKECSIKILELPKDSPCHQSALISKHKGIKLASVGNGIRTYTAGRTEFLHTMPQNSEACMKEQKDGHETW